MPSREVKRWHAQILEEKGWETVRDGVEPKLAKRETRHSSCVARRNDSYRWGLERKKALLEREASKPRLVV